MGFYNLVHAIAYCEDCGWHEEDYLIAQKEARKHHRKTGHEVVIETGLIGTYERKSPTQNNKAVK